MSATSNLTHSWLSTPIEYLKGVGTARAELLKKELGIFSLNDLLFHFPYRHIDRSRIYAIQEIRDDMPYVQLMGKIGQIRQIGQKKGHRLVANLTDHTGSIELVWFQGAKWVRESLQEGKEYLVFGKPVLFNGSYNMAHPMLDDPKQTDSKKYLSIMPFYTITERMRNKGLDSKVLMKLTNALLTDSRFDVAENLSESILKKHGLISRKVALTQIHFPSNIELLKQAQQRLRFEELFFLQLKLLRYKFNRTRILNGIKLEKVGELFNEFYKNHLPFQLTEAQKRVIREIRADVRSGRQMNRLLQGDVGSGKTIVALLILLLCMDNGYQGCMMAPTEILAQQHFQSVSQLLDKIPVKVRLLTGSSSAKERKEILKGIDSGEIQLLIGTHALIEEDVRFNKLGLAIIDEQHRFGVEQRSKLWKKNVHPPHVLVMTATPIPRTLAMTLYGDLDYSAIDELPPGRRPIKTVLQKDANRLKVYGFLRSEIEKGRQVYVVYPLIAENEKLDFMNLMHGFEDLIKFFPPPQYQICMVHGKLKPSDKEREMQRFVKGQAQIMVATTVIEVGVNVPNATVMVIENAERFGLSQLHQLRGRVGRGGDQSWCILMSSYKLSNDARQRLQTMVETQNGFEIAEVDLKLRGPGQLEGTQQSGVPELKLANLVSDQELMQQARNEAEDLLNRDPELRQAENAGIYAAFVQYTQNNKWGRIS